MKERKFYTIAFVIISIIAQVIPAYTISLNDDWDYTMRTTFNRNIDLFEHFNATSGFRDRQKLYLNSSRFSYGLNAQAARIFLGDEVNDDSIESDFDRLFDIEGMKDFSWASYVRLLYLDINKSLIDSKQKDEIIQAFGSSKFWFTESKTSNTAIVYTENHQLLCHTAQYLIGQLFPNDTFVYTDTEGIKHKKTGLKHVEEAKERIIQWLNWRGQFGFCEWHSNSYLNPDITCLVNLVDFAMDSEIVYKAAMVLDLIAFGFACNYYKNRYATSMGRCYDDRRVGQSSDSISEAAWLMLGIGKHNPCDNNDRAAVALATSKHYAPPPILEDIAYNATKYFEHKERHNIDIDEGKKYGIKYNEDDMMLWWGMSAPLAPQTIETSFEMLEKYNIDPNTILGPQILVDFIKVMSFFQGLTVSEYSEKIKAYTEGVSLQTANIYTYRTPYYQLSGAQDQKSKGMTSFQEHTWQASLDDNAYVFTNSPGAIVKNFDQHFMGGWRPRTTLYKNMGIIQYDREKLPIEAELINFFFATAKGFEFNMQHAYFPRFAFDEVYQEGKWTLGAKDNGYIALYSYEPTWWASDYELRVNSIKNVWIIELGSKEEYSSFENFKDEILDTEVIVEPLKIGFDIRYKSPSQGKVTVDWGGSMKVDGKKVDLGNYRRFQNQYCTQEFGTKRTQIYYENQYLELNFNNVSRYYNNI